MTEDGREVYLWYHGTGKDWRLADGSDFKARNQFCYMYINSKGKQEL